MQAEENRAAISEVDRASGRRRIFATGLRNPNRLSWEPQTGALWTVVNERGEVGPNLVPDYLTSVKKRLLRLRHLIGPGLCRQGRGETLSKR
jgi:glucose/arabinose dehydrogenase